MKQSNHRNQSRPTAARFLSQRRGKATLKYHSPSISALTSHLLGALMHLHATVILRNCGQLSSKQRANLQRDFSKAFVLIHKHSCTISLVDQAASSPKGPSLRHSARTKRS